jgi:hypothetical protein
VLDKKALPHHDDGSDLWQGCDLNACRIFLQIPHGVMSTILVIILRAAGHVKDFLPL